MGEETAEIIVQLQNMLLSVPIPMPIINNITYIKYRQCGNEGTYMNINQTVVSNKLGESNDIIKDAAARLKNIIDLGSNEIDEQKLREEFEAKIQAKLEAGKRLTEKELNYLKKYNPQLYAHALRIEMKRRAVEEQLKHAKSKRQVQEIEDQALCSIGKNDPVKKYMVAAVCRTVSEFRKTESYQKLPETEQKKDSNRTNKLKNQSDDGEEDDTVITYEIGAASYQMAFAEKVSEAGKGFTAVS